MTIVLLTMSIDGNPVKDRELVGCFDEHTHAMKSIRMANRDMRLVSSPSYHNVEYENIWTKKTYRLIETDVYDSPIAVM